MVIDADAYFRVAREAMLKGIAVVRPGATLGDIGQAIQRHAEAQGWEFQILELSQSELGGVREAVARIAGEGVFARLKYESGVHRVQRIPSTESGGRIHTSAATVAVLPEAAEDDVRQMTARERRSMGFKDLPASLDDALVLMEKSELVAETLGEHVFEYFLRNKWSEWNDYRAVVTPFELDRFLSL